MNKQGYWEREDGEPWESVESLPPPPSEARLPTPEAFAWKSLESLPSPFDARPKASPAASRTVPAPPAKEGWSFRNLKQEEDGEDEKTVEEEWASTPLSPTAPRAITRLAVEDDVVSVGGFEYMPFNRLPAPTQLPDRHPYSPYPAPSPFPYPGPLYQGPVRGSTWRGPVHRRHYHSGITSLSALVEQLGISAPVCDRRCGIETHRPLDSLASPPKKPRREDINIATVTYEVREEKLYAGDREDVFPKPPTYIPPIAKKARPPLRKRWQYEERYTHTHKRRRLLTNYSNAAAPAIDPFWEERACLWPRDKYENLIPNNPNNLRPFSLAKNLERLMREWKNQGLAKMSKRRKSEREKEKSRSGRYAYHSRSENANGKEPSAGGEDDGEENGVDEDKEQSAPEWTDEEEDTHRQRGHVHLRRDSTDAHGIDDRKSIHYSPTSTRAFNVKRIRDTAVKALCDPKKNKHTTKRKAPAFAMDGQDIEGMYDTFSTEDSPKPKKVDPHGSFKKTTGRHPRHFHKSRKYSDEIFERFVLDRRPLADGEEEPTGKNKRRPMIDTANLKTGKRSRRKIRGYGKLPMMIRIAAGVEGLGGLPPRRQREVEEDGNVQDGEGGESVQKPKRKKKKDGCVVM